MSFFFAIPESLLTELLSNWLPATAACRVDSACCNRQSRTVLLRALGQTYFLQSGRSINENMFRWMLLREVRWNEVVYGSLQAKPFGDNALELLLATTCQSVTAFVFRKDKRDSSPRFEPTQRSMRLVAKYCPELRTFTFSNTRLSPCVSEVISACVALQEINFHGVSSLPADIFQVCFSAPAIKSVILKNCDFPNTIKPVGTCLTIQSLSVMETGLTAAQALHLCEHCPNLTHLLIQEYQGFVDLIKIAQLCPLLQKCTIADPCGIDVSRAEELCKASKALTELTLYYINIGSCNVCPEDALQVLVSKCPTLRYLQACESPLARINDRRRIIASPLTPSVGPQLCELVVGSLTAAAMETILATCVHLHTLHVIYLRRSYSQYATAFIEDSLDLLHHSSVKKLILQDTADFSGEHLLKIAHLEELQLQCVSGDFASDDVIEAITQCPELHTLMLSFPPSDQITRSDIRRILDAAPKLHTFVYADREESDSFPSMEALREMMSTSYPHIKDSELTSVKFDYT